MTGLFQRSRFLVWGGWALAALLLLPLIGLFVVMPLSRGISASNYYLQQEESVGGAAPSLVALATSAPAFADQDGQRDLVPGTVALPERLIIRNGNVSLVVDDTRAAQKEIEKLVSDLAGDGAFVVSSTEQGGTEDRPPRINMSVRIPATHFDEMMDKLAALAVRVNDRTESAQDVTEEYVDLKARQQSLDTARQRLLEIMQRSETTEDLLQAEQQLTQREAEIESIKGRVQYLEQSARLSSITIALEPSVLSQPVATGWRPAETVREAIDRLLERGQDFVDWLIGFTIADLPWLLFFGVVVWGVVRLVQGWRARQRRKHLAASEPPAEEKKA